MKAVPLELPVQVPAKFDGADAEVLSEPPPPHAEVNRMRPLTNIFVQIFIKAPL
jgi:hypothetical protein